MIPMQPFPSALCPLEVLSVFIALMREAQDGVVV